MGKTSSIKDRLFGDTLSYSRLLEPISLSLIDKYPSQDLQPIFKSLPTRSITTGPMSMCARLLQDFHIKPDPKLLQAVGTMCLHISTHDDLIDEPPKTRREKAALLYAGNISFIEGCQLLHTIFTPDQTAPICEMISKNHLLQQQCVNVLWEARPQTFADYALGVEHDGALVGIGVMAALVVADKQHLWDSIEQVCTSYGTALQLLDDIAEVDEDEIAGYHSFPLHEGAPFTQSFQKINDELALAQSLLDPDWVQFGELINNARALAQTLAKPII